MLFLMPKARNPNNLEKIIHNIMEKKIHDIVEKRIKLSEKDLNAMILKMSRMHLKNSIHNLSYHNLAQEMSHQVQGLSGGQVLSNLAYELQKAITRNF